MIREKWSVKDDEEEVAGGEVREGLLTRAGESKVIIGCESGGRFILA